VGDDTIFAKVFIVRPKFIAPIPPSSGSMFKFNAVDEDTFEWPFETTEDEIKKEYGPVINDDDPYIYAHIEPDHNKNKVYTVEGLIVKDRKNLVMVESNRNPKVKDLVQVVGKLPMYGYRAVLLHKFSKEGRKNTWMVKPLTHEDYRISKMWEPLPLFPSLIKNLLTIISYYELGRLYFCK